MYILDFLSTGDVGDRDDVASCTRAQSACPDNTKDRHTTNEFTVSAVQTVSPLDITFQCFFTKTRKLVGKAGLGSALPDRF